jgi:hypothetical protein
MNTTAQIIRCETGIRPERIFMQGVAGSLSAKRFWRVWPCGFPVKVHLVVDIRNEQTYENFFYNNTNI